VGPVNPGDRQETQTDTDPIRALLLERLEEVEREIGERREAATPGGERPGFGKRAGDYVAQVVDDRTNTQVADRLEETAARIRHAIDRLELGSYGTCRTCGQAIIVERLAALPWAEQCIACESGAKRSLLDRRR
jgi:DnaK suppressor protein